MAEVKIGEYVVQVGRQLRARWFAEILVADLARIHGVLMDRGLELKLTAVNGLDAQQLQKFDAFKKLKGSEFDREFTQARSRDI